ncbi:MAG: LON peptidase substrate-binding domain-containing protein [Limnobacter sp.]|nr:LON peptidase substrate-binding domain-containing protein [Limnobacter sp.]
MSDPSQFALTPTLEIPLFPLTTVLFPGGYLPLQIFEVRYLTMIRECAKKKEAFGVVTLMHGQETRKPGEDIRLSPVGTLAGLEEIEEETPSLLKVKTTGRQRFQLKSADQLDNGLWMGTVELMKEDPAVSVPEDLQRCAHLLVELIHSFDEQNIPPHQRPIQPPHHLDDCGWLANRWCEVLPIQTDIKLQLLGLDNPLVRLELINDLIKTPS